MINSADNKPVAELLSVDSKWCFKVPRYQREYVWKRDDWAALFDDIWGNPAGYFLGSMICINRSKDTMAVQELEVVDGQQRLTTLSVLYAAIHTCLKRFGDADEELRNELFNLRCRLVFKGSKGALRLEPSRQGSNFDDYVAILGETGALKEFETPRNAGNRRLFKAYRYFIDRFDELDNEEKNVFDLEKIKLFMERLNQASLVKIEVSSHADAFTLFASLNNRGVPLSALDLIKNNLLADLEKKTPDSIHENFIKWTKLLENLSDDNTVQERFLRQYYNAFKYKKEFEDAKVPLATRSNIISIYESLISRDANWLFDDLFKKAKLFNKLIAPLNDGVPHTLAKQLIDLERIGGTPAYILLLYLMAEQPDTDLAGIGEFLVNYFVRRNLTDVPPTRDLPHIFIEIIEKIRNASHGDVMKIIREELMAKEHLASDSTFRDKLAGGIYLDNVDVTRFILCRIEEAENQTREKLTDLWKRDQNGDFVWTVEHVFPQGENIPAAWVKMIADGDAEKAEEYRDKYVHKLGNLTISGYNSKLGNKAFEEKRDRKDSRGQLVGYRNGLFLNKSLADSTSWRVSDIETRTKMLVEIAVQLFALK